MLRGIFIYASVIFILNSLVIAQPQGRMRGFQKMEELKKIKLIETLQMDEETSLKFFSRRSEHMKKIDGLNELREKQIDVIENILKDKKATNEATLKKEINEYYQITDKIHKERQNFINSISEILTNEQMAKFIVFEERFRNEVNALLLKERNRRLRD